VENPEAFSDFHQSMQGQVLQVSIFQLLLKFIQQQRQVIVEWSEELVKSL